MIRAAAGLLAALVVAGCGGAAVEEGTATVWITRDRGARVLRTATVPAGLTAMQALRRVADVETRYGGRFVQSIDGLAGSLSARRDWFYFVNGYDADRSASEYRLHPGDVEWWDYRRWSSPGEVKVVVGAFPEPFLHGFAGERLVTRLDARAGADPEAVLALAERLDAVTVPLAELPRGRENVLVLVPAAKVSFTARQHPGDGPGDPVTFTFRGNPWLLVREPERFRFEYEVMP